MSRLDLAVLVYDLRGSGAVLNALRIAERAAASGLNTELWVMRRQGQLEDATPASLPVVALRARAADYDLSATLDRYVAPLGQELAEIKASRPGSGQLRSQPLNRRT